MRDDTLKGLADAGIAGMGAAGSRRFSANAVRYSSRARRRGFDREAERLKAGLEAKVGPITGWPADERACEEVAAIDPDFAEFLSDLRALQRKWFG